MTVISIRGVDERAIFRLKQQAEVEGASLNSLVVRVLETAAGVRAANKQPQRFDDLNALQGTWSHDDACEFESATGDFSAIDPGLWK